MLTIEHVDPRHVAIESFIFYGVEGEEILVEEAEPMTLCIDNKGDLVYGSGETVLRITHKTALNDLLSRVRPSSFRLICEDDGELSLAASLNESLSDKADVLESIPIIDKTFSDAVEIQSIRSMEQ